LSIQFGVKLAAFFTLMGAFSSFSAGQQTTPPANSDTPAQTQTQDTTTGKPVAAQQPAPSADQSKDKAKDKSTQPSDQGKVAGTSNDRLFYTLPNFLSLQGAGKLPPMTAKDKFKVVALGTFDYVEYPWWGLLAAINQAENSEPAFGQGWAAYGKRYGTTMGDSLVENFMVGAVFPSVLHQDPRFYQSEKGGFWAKGGYAISRIFVTRTDSGHPQFNFSEIFGSASAAAISSYTYHPSSTYISTPKNPHLFIGSERTLSNAASVWGTQLTLDTITIVIKEFWPDIHRKMAHKTTPAPPSTPQ
jgi:hypothetical protein